jgi:glucosamine 6-phosphate synthetase-like amidotransferase/phosphosugar isomerase protein
MCGLFGALGPKIEESKIRGLALINRERGTDAVGFFDDRGKMCKMAKDPLKGILTDSMAGFIRKACNESWFVAGHTRYSTMGTGKDDSCAHPFRYGKTVGAHNGVVMAPREYDVDSQYIFDLLNTYNQDYQKALVDLDGYFALTWLDKKTGDFYMLCHDNEITIGLYGDTYYYSSDADHLEAVCGPTEVITKLQSGDVIKFSFVDGKVVTEVMANFKSNTRAWKLTRAQRASGYYDSDWADWEGSAYKVKGTGTASAGNSTATVVGGTKSSQGDIFSKVSDYVDWEESWSQYLSEERKVGVKA